MKGKEEHKAMGRGQSPSDSSCKFARVTPNRGANSKDAWPEKKRRCLKAREGDRGIVVSPERSQREQKRAFHYAQKKLFKKEKNVVRQGNPAESSLPGGEQILKQT